MREDGQSSKDNGIHSYEVQKIEVLGETPNTTNGAGGLNSELEDTSAVAKLLKGVDKVYEKGKNILKESKISDERINSYRDNDETADILTDRNGSDNEIKNSKIQPIGKGVFGNIYDQFKDNVKAAFEFLLNNKSGDLLGVFSRDGFGDIDLVWGDKGGGAEHILRKHVGNGKSFSTAEECFTEIDRIIKKGEKDFENGDKIIFKDGNRIVTVRKNWRKKGKKIADKNWVLTAYDEMSADSESPVATIKSLAGSATSISNGKGSEYSLEKKEKEENISDNEISAGESMTRHSIRTKPAPKNTITAYKLFKVDESGKPHALFIDKGTALANSVWYDADCPSIDVINSLDEGYSYLMDMDGRVYDKSIPLL